MIAPPIEGPRLALGPLSEADAGSRYLAWLNDPDVVRLTEARHTGHSADSIREFIAACNACPHTWLWGIFERVGGMHVGNIKLGPVASVHRCGALGLIIGERSRWGRGYATEALGLAVRLAFEELHLHKIVAGVIAGNDASLRAFESNGFVVEGTRRRQNLLEGVWRDEIQLGLLCEEHQGG